MKSEDESTRLMPLDVPDKKDGDDDNDDLLLWCLFCSGDADEGPLIETPCACTGCYVHTACLSKWITSKQKGRNREISKFDCEVCRQPYRGVSSKSRFECKFDSLVLRSMLRICCGLAVAIGLMVWGIQSVVQTDGEGVGANLFLPLALAMFCFGCLNCVEVLFTYYVRNTHEAIRFEDTPVPPAEGLPVAAPAPLTSPSTMLMEVGGGSYGSVDTPMEDVLWE